MRKRIITLVLILALALSMTAHAAEPRVTKVLPTLDFSGTTANCQVIVTDSGKDIEVIMTLYHGLTRIDYWTGSGTSYVKVTGDCKVTDGTTYRLVITGTIDGVPFTATEVVGTCGG